MRTRLHLILTAVVLLPGVCGAAEPKSLEEAIADVNAKSAKIKTYAADFDMIMNMGAMEMNVGGTMQGKGNLMRMSTTMDMMQQKIAMTVILDASNTMWMDMDMMGMKQVMKMDMATMLAMQEQTMGMMPGGMGGLGGMGGMQNDPRQMLEMTQKTMNLSYGGTDDFNNEKVYVFGAKIKDEYKEQLNQSTAAGDAAAMGMDLVTMMGDWRLKFGVDDGFIRGIEMLDTNGTPWMTQTYKNLKLDGPMDDALFAYTPPAGVTVIDMADMLEAMQQQDAGAGEPANGAQP